jgi:hypothetical protein
MWRNVILACVILTLGCSSAFGENSLVVESRTIGVGVSATVGVFFSNDEPVRSMCIPLVVREITPGVYPTALSASFPVEGRLGLDYTTFPPGYLWENISLAIYDNEDGTCKYGQPGGFGTITVSGAGLTYNEHPSPSSPDGFGITRNRMNFEDLPAGTDGVVPSIAFSVTAPMTAGMFEIDSTCRDPACHLLFDTPYGYVLPVTFTKGIISVIPCDCPYQGDYDHTGWCNSADMALLIDILFKGVADTQDPSCPATRSDMDCDGFATPMDLAYMIDYLWDGGPWPCNPCSDL